MFKQAITRISKTSPRVAILVALIAVVAMSGVILLVTRGGSEANANPAMQPHAARLDRVDGSVGIARAEQDDNKDLDWAEATVNTPVTVGDRIYARDYAHASVALNGHNFVRINPTTSLDVLALDDSRSQFALRNGSAVFDVGELDSDDLFEVATPCGAVDFKQPGLYQVGLDNGNAIISVLNGVAQVVGQEGSGTITKGQVFTLTGASPTEAVASTLAPDAAGEIVDDYYRYRYPKLYNGRYRNYDAYLSDPSYYDPYRTSVSYQYLPADIPGLYDLDDYGDWVDLDNYGHCWAPRVSSGWAPFQSGFWDLDPLWGPSWVSYEPWGWAPYHYGRWSYVSSRWFWIPAEVRTRPAYCPAPVAFVTVADQIGWVPLAPGEVFVPRYYDNFRPRYIATPDVIRLADRRTTFINYNVPGAVTVIPVRSLTRRIDVQTISRADQTWVGKSRVVADPFSVDSVRQLAVNHDDGRRRIKFDRREQNAFNTPVVASTAPAVLPDRANFAKSMRVESVASNKKDNKLKIDQSNQVTTTVRRSDAMPQPMVQSQRMNDLAARAQQGDKAARQEMRQLMRNEQQQKAQSQAAAQVQQEQTRQQQKQQQRAERQQQAGAAANQQAAQQAQQQQLKQQRRIERQQQSAAAAQRGAQQAQQQQQLKQQRRIERQQQSSAAAQRGAQQQQLKQQRRIERQQQSSAGAQRAAQQQQMRQQMKQQQRVQRQEAARPAPQQRSKPPKQQPPQAMFERPRFDQQAARQMQMAQQNSQLKAQRRAEQQRAMSQEMSRRSSMQAQQMQSQRAQRQMMQQQAARAQAMQQQRQTAFQQQAARAQAMQQQQAIRQQQTQRAPGFMGPPVRQGGAPQQPQKQRKSPQ